VRRPRRADARRARGPRGRCAGLTAGGRGRLHEVIEEEAAALVAPGDGDDEGEGGGGERGASLEIGGAGRVIERPAGAHDAQGNVGGDLQIGEGVP